MHEPALRWTPSGYELPSFAPVTPDSVSDGSVEQARLVIVGGGLTGLTLAADLACRGIKAVLLDDDNTVGVRGASSRGMVWAQKSLEIMDRIGVAGRMVEKGVTWSVGRTMSGDEAVYSFNRAEGNASCQPPFVNLQQFYLEWFLVERLAELGHVELRWNNEVTGVTQEGDVVYLDVATKDGPYRIAADWVVDATGANSPVRQALGLQPAAARHVDQWCICDARCTDLQRPERWTWVDAPFNGGRAVWQHMMADNVWRLDYQLDPDGDPDDVARPDIAAERVRAHLGPDVEFELVWVGPWAYRTQLMDRFRGGRVIFAGDAAHVMSPFGARGGNSGIQDAENLGWKLALVLRGLAGDTLLDTYDAERRAAARENIEVTSRTARFLAPQSPFERDMRAALLELAREHAFARAIVNTGRLSVANRYGRSAIVESDAGFCLGNLPLRAADGSGTTLNTLMLAAGTSAIGFYLPRPGVDPMRAVICGIGGEGLPYVVRTLDAGQAAAHCAFVDAQGHLSRLTGARPGDLIVVRPDLYCAAVIRDASAAGAEQALARAVGFGGGT